MNTLQAKWDAIYSQRRQAEAAKVLVEHTFLLPKNGRALDLACGLGENALLMAKCGLNVDAWDISLVALQKLQTQAVSRNLQINPRFCNISTELLPKDTYDVIVISRFLDRELCNAIMAALKIGGLLFYQTFTRNKLAEDGPNNPDFLLANNELPHLFAALTLVYYREYARIGDLRYGDRNEASYIGQKF
jgi:2-polyprenyl-3-methyl-5-hydroxy-6-metoxy-1,4-benzoquinol methylase